MAAEAREHSAEAVRRERLPGLGIEGKFEYGRAPNRDKQDNPFVYDPFNARSFNAAFGLRWDLSFKQNAAKVAREEAEAQAARARRDAVATRLRLELGRLRARLDEATSVYETSRRALSTTANWLRVADENHALGTASTNDVVDSYTAYVQARVAHYDAIRELNLALVAWRLAQGREAARRRRSSMSHDFRRAPVSRSRVLLASILAAGPTAASSGPLVDALKARQARIDSILSAHPGKLAAAPRGRRWRRPSPERSTSLRWRAPRSRPGTARSAAERAEYAVAFEKLIRRSLMRRVDIYRIEGVDYRRKPSRATTGGWTRWFGPRRRRPRWPGSS